MHTLVSSASLYTSLSYIAKSTVFISIFIDSAVLKNNLFICPFILSVLFKIKHFMDFYSFFFKRVPPEVTPFVLVPPLMSHCSKCLFAFLTHNLYLPKYLLTLVHAGISFFTAIETTGG